MAEFEKAAARIPTEIGDIECTLFVPGATSTHQPGANFRLKVHYSDGSMQERAGNLVPFLTQPQISALLSFMDDLRAQAIAQIIPTP